jgi:hypothetical protein
MELMEENKRYQYLRKELEEAKHFEQNFNEAEQRRQLLSAENYRLNGLL